MTTVGSQSFNQIFSTHELVTKNNGAFSLSRPIVSLPGIRKSINLGLHLRYSTSAAGIFGLPTGWQFDVPYIDIDANSLHFKGSSFIIDADWADSTGYSSGLRYENNHGISFAQVIPPAPLPSGNPGSYAYILNCKDGGHCYFDTTGKLLEKDDRYGNCIQYTYNDQFSGVKNNGLTSIIDSYGQTTSFSFGANTIVATLPDGSEVQVVYTSQGVSSITDQLSQVYSFDYTTAANGTDVVNSISYPTGLTTTVTYSSLVGNLSGGGTEQFTSVSSIQHADACGFLDETKYTFGTLTAGNTFTGANAGYTMSSSHDALIDSNNENYFYDVYIERVDQAGTLLAASSVTFNFAHFPVESKQYSVDNAGNANDALKINYTYDIALDAHARTPNYNKPVTTEHSAYDSATSAYVSLKKETYSYNYYADKISYTLSVYNTTTKLFVEQKNEAYTYTEVSWESGEASTMPETSSITDVVTGLEEQWVFTLTDDQRSVASKTLSTNESGTLSALKTLSYAYDDCGRRTSKCVAWAEGATSVGSVSSSTVTYSYDYNSTTNELAVTTVDPLGGTEVAKKRVDLPKGPVVNKVNQLSNTETATFDALGRILSKTDANDNTTTRAYKSQQLDDLNAVDVTFANGYVKRSVRDGYEREIQELDNVTAGNTVTRVLSVHTFGPLNKIVSKVDRYGRTTTAVYDSLGRLTSMTDVQGNKQTKSYPLQTTIHTSLNEVLLSKEYFNGLGQKIQAVTFPVNDTKMPALSTVTTYTGRGQKYVVTSAQVDQETLAVIAVLSTTEYSYTVDGKESTVSFEGLVDSKATLKTSNSYDLLCKKVSSIKKIAYGKDNPYTYNSSTKAYDALGNLITVTNEAGGSTSYSYNAAHQLIKRVDVAGNATTYTRDAVGNITGKASGSKSISYTYDDMNRATSLVEASSTMSMSYTLDGNIESLTYPNQSQQSYERDAEGRVTSATDALGNTTTLTYNTDGQLDTIVHGGDTMTLSYGTVDGKKGVLVSESMAGETTWTRELSYNSYFRLSQDVTSCAGKTNTVAYQYDPLFRLSSMSVATEALTYETSYGYDGLGQVTSYSTTEGGSSTTVTYTYDGNANILTESSGGNTTTYTYNDLNQLTIDGVTYDAAGNVTQDPSGATYSYNAFGKLETITPKSGDEVSLNYYPNGLLAGRTAGSTTDTLYYTGGMLNAIQQGTSKAVSYMLRGKKVLGEYSSSGSPSYYLHGNKSVVGLFGATTKGYSYAPYGAGNSEGGVFQWKQAYQEPTSGLVYQKARYYNPQLMRFMSADTFVMNNRYVYGVGDPVNFIDPSGHMSFFEVLGGIVTALSIVAAPFTEGGSLEVGAEIDSAVVAADGAATVMEEIVATAGEEATADVTADTSEATAADEFGAPWSRVNPAGRDDNCAFCTIGNITGSSASSVARETGMQEGIISSDQISSMMQSTGLSRTGSFHDFSTIDEFSDYVATQDPDDEYVVGLNNGPGQVGHVVHGYRNTFGFFFNDAQQQIPDIGLDAVKAKMPVRVFRADAQAITRILNPSTGVSTATSASQGAVASDPDADLAEVMSKLSIS